MRIIEPRVFLIGETRLIPENLQAYLEHIGVPEWTSDAPTDSELINEVMGRVCYKSFGTGLNPNITKVREGNKPYLDNIRKVRHGSVLEHSSFNFIFADVSRVFTHELITHRVGMAKSQESLRFVRLTDLNAWLPTIIREDEEATEIFVATYKQLEELQIKMAKHFNLDDPTVPFSIKKEVTSALRRLAPIGLATNIGWSANARLLRHVIEMRTEPHAEEEIRVVFGKVAEIVIERYPNLFGDYEIEIINGHTWYKTENSKV